MGEERATAVRRFGAEPTTSASVGASSRAIRVTMRDCIVRKENLRLSEVWLLLRDFGRKLDGQNNEEKRMWPRGQQGITQPIAFGKVRADGGAAVDVGSRKRKSTLCRRRKSGLRKKSL